MLNKPIFIEYKVLEVSGTKMKDKARVKLFSDKSALFYL